MFYFSLIILPLFNFLNLFFFGRFMGLLGSKLFSFFLNFINFIIFIFIIIFKLKFPDQIVILDITSWFNLYFFDLRWQFIFDNLSIIMIFLILSITNMVILYSMYYLSTDPFLTKFLSFISFFQFFMVVLVTSSNLILILLGWEGVGLCSFLLIGFWTNRVSACKAALKAIVFNRIGDLGFIIGLSLIYIYSGSLNIYVLNNFIIFFNSTLIYTFFGLNIFISDFILFFFFLGVMGKSAQLGLHVWLLDAMEGPTPVSALIHAATMVTAGVFLLIKLSFIFNFCTSLKIFIAYTGIFTTIFSGIMGSFQNDIKSIIALSTCSQLGYMVTILGLSNFSLSFFHLINHGFFKALLFLSSGIIIHNFFEEQDIRKMGGLFQLYPLTYLFFLLGSFSLLGIPFLSGFYSKDFIIEFIYLLPFTWSCTISQFALYGTFFTAFYSFRLIYYVFISEPNGYKFNYINSNENYPYYLILVFLFISFFSLFSGYLLHVMFSGIGSLFFNNSFSLDLSSKIFLNLEFFFLQSHSLWINHKFIPIYWILFSFFLLIYLNVFSVTYLSKIYNFKLYHFFYSFFYLGFYFNYIYISKFFNFFVFLCWNFFYLDKYFLETFYIKNFISYIYFFFKKINIFNFSKEYYFFFIYVFFFF